MDDLICILTHKENVWWTRVFFKVKQHHKLDDVKDIDL
jgi:hypothetical protein